MTGSSAEKISPTTAAWARSLPLSSLTSVSVRLLQGERLLALGLTAFSTSRRGLEFAQAPMPKVRGPEQCPPLERRIEIHHRYEHRWAIGSLPFSGNGERALCGGWIRLAEPRVNDALSVAAFTDGFPPAIFSACRTR